MPIFDDAMQPSLALGTDGTVFLAMLQRGNIVVASSKDGGRRFTSPVIALDCGGKARGGRQRGPRIGIGRQGTLTVSAPVTFDTAEQAKRYPAPELYAAQSKDGGKTFSVPLQVNSVAKKAPEGLHMLAVGNDGVAHLVWLDLSERTQPGQDIFYARLAQGKLEGRTVIARTVCECCAPGMALDGKGNPTVTWREGDLKESREVFFRRSFDSGRSFSQTRQVNTDPTKEAG
jgi:hypothetical protein